MLLSSVSASVQYDAGAGSRISPLDANASIASEVGGHEDVREMFEQLELAFSAGTTISMIQLAQLPETGTVFLQTVDDRKHAKTIPLQIVSSVPATGNPGLMEL